MTGSTDSTGMTGATGRPDPAPAFGRRALLGTGLGAAAALVAAGSGPAQAAPNAAPRTSGTSARRRGQNFLAAAMDSYPDHGAVRLTQSYTDQAGLFSTAFTYDNALAILAHLAVRTADGRARAVALGDALIYAQEHDPAYDDGRLRQAYNVGPYVYYDGVPQPDGFVRADGTANVGTQFGFTGTAVGDMAWAGIALSALARRTGARRFLAAAVRIGQWIERTGRTDEPLGGYKFGVNGANEKLPFTSTEHNTDLVCLFGRLARLTGDRVWGERRARAEAFVRRMWEPSRGSTGGFFYTGTNDGVTVNKSPIPEDTQTWTHLALGSRRYARSLDWAVRELAVLDHAERRNSTVPAGESYEGVTFSSASLLANEDAPIAEFQPRPNRNGVWFEGTAHLALALRDRGARGDEARARRLLASLESAQDHLGAAQTIGGRALPARSGIVSASSPLDTGFGFGYYPYRHTGATAWYLMAAARANPLGV
ncbi:Tat pathway signal sequence domain protein [Streptomyces stelliscabiei]|uniref:Tat pathway signal sequence domain protein n=1 Tax=Streptomyces stelliscabiei TaxID=146820 RepID=UPI0029AC611E|nr:Tat pathway signal sequence domain protein [Streptomyces stelliscabiei]MDX2552849.1 Tat pathway signal sequence domain protein [Streptomyces stelliscabiei]MDX2613830.1 Tat pathway signal sequence domain protein [Streptomyces stelliscabiei]MDX2638051.1 Tat pathway signal sequence domain protein [Streptomyces stelliscabiei]MDX2661484.1 Tat pathway signal sequence domain protein [Streptomyces stelliscabiei]MDX2713071.1 Tat pathway signal sequence domain protein [Streptomyces stelliscabiei]